jgi:hypothetical protein
MKLSSLIKEQMDIGDILYSKRDQIELDYGPRTFKTLQSSLMMDDEAYVRNWLIKKGYMDEEKSPFEEQIKDVIKKEIDECWKTYKQVGMKKKGNKMVPNCVPKNEEVDENLRNWFKKEKWKRIDTQGNIAGDCGTMPKGKKTQRCLPQAKAQSLTKKQRAATSRKKTASNKQFVKNTKAAKVKK